MKYAKRIFHICLITILVVFIIYDNEYDNMFSEDVEPELREPVKPKRSSHKAHHSKKRSSVLESPVPKTSDVESVNAALDSEPLTTKSDSLSSQIDQGSSSSKDSNSELPSSDFWSSSSSSSTPSTTSARPSEALQTFESVRYKDFCVFPNVVSTGKRNGTITMVTHCSANYFGDNLVKMACQWDGQVSFATFANELLSKTENDSSVENVIRRIHGLVACSSCLADALFAHIFIYVPTGDCRSISVDLTVLPTCSELTNSTLAWFRSATPSQMYPVNTGRNIGRLFHTTPYFLFADMEQEYSVGAEAILRNLTKLYNLKKEKMVIVPRRFEYDDSKSAPLTMKDLKAAHGKTSFEFHKYLWPVSHKVPLLKEWLNENRKIDPHIIDIKNRTHSWEPMFVASSTMPLHNEEITYGMSDHVSLVIQMCCEGYRFLVAPSVFSQHAGIRRKARGLTYKSRALGGKALNKFYYDMARQYPLTARQCLKGRYRELPPTTHGFD